MNAYAKLNRTSRGREINRKLERSAEVCEIRPIDRDAFYCPRGATDPQCNGHTHTVFIDPDNVISLPTANGMQPTPLEVTLGHELGHANGERDDGPSRMNNVNANENPIRQDLGLPLRTAYTSMRYPIYNFILGISILVAEVACGKISAEAKHVRQSVGTVYYYGFEIERITGIPEAQIAELGCAYEIDKESFLKMLKQPRGRPPFGYDSSDVRAKISFSKQEIYFVEYQGVVRGSENARLIDKSEFVSALKRVASKRCR